MLQGLVGPEGTRGLRGLQVSTYYNEIYISEFVGMIYLHFGLGCHSIHYLNYSNIYFFNVMDFYLNWFFIVALVSPDFKNGPSAFKCCKLKVF